MTKKNLFYFLAVLVLVAGPAWGQVVHHNDDRDLFIGVGNSSGIKPNIVVLADNSASMNTAIYHIDYVAKTNYKKDAAGNSLQLNNIGNFFSYYTDNVYKLSASTTFTICRPKSQGQWVGDASATFNGRIKANDPTRWKVYKSSVVGFFPYVNQVIDYNCNTSGNCSQTRIISVTSANDPKWPKAAYWNIEVDTAYPGYNNDPVAGSTIYINYHWDAVFTGKTAYLISPGTNCVGDFDQFNNIKLYGNYENANPTNNPSEGQTRYDTNYLYWLAFHATQQQLNEVTYWASTGMSPDKNGVLVDTGYYRIEVMRRVLADVMREVHGDVNLGLACFNPSSSNEGGYVRENLQNFNTLSSLEEMIKNNITNLIADTNTPLAETMADIWYYIKGGTSDNYWPNADANGNIQGSCPIKFSCQKNYIIVMTDGESTRDRFILSGSTKYTTSYFASTSVKRSNGVGWGDGDDNDPMNTSAVKPNGDPYCPNYTCWIDYSDQREDGSDYLDDMAAFLHREDLFPDAYYPTMPGKQSIETYVIGFNMDNDLLAETADKDHGDGEYYTARSYDELKTALTNAITSINLRNMAFAAFTAPKKITTAVGDGYSFVGYFMPSEASAIWTGHLQSFLMTDRYYADLDNDGKLESDNNGSEPGGLDEYVNPYFKKSDCETASGLSCMRSLDLANQPEWDLQQTMTATRNLFTHDSGAASPYALIDFTVANAAALQPLFQLDYNSDPAIPLAQATSIIGTIGGKSLGDLFHSDIAYVGPPLAGKVYVRNLNPPECGTNGVLKEDDSTCFESLLKAWGADPAVADSGRHKVLYAGSNDGIMHQVDAKTGAERWGFIPDEVLPTLKKIVVENQYAYTVDGRLTADDIYYYGATANSWKTVLVFGLKDGGNSFYALDITDADANPTLLWKFKDDVYSGKSWSKPFFGKIRHLQTNGSWIDRWVVIVAGGMAFNNEDKTDYAGKAIFVIDASSGDLLWSIGYKPTGVTDPGAADVAGTPVIETAIDSSVTTGLRYLTAKDDFNYPIPSAITPVDRDADGYLDTIYFGNVAGHLFKIDMASNNPRQWKTYQLFKKTITHQASTTISNITGGVITVQNAGGFDLHDNVFQPGTGAMGTIDAVDNKQLTVKTISASAFVQDNTKPIVVPGFDPVFLSPAVFYDKGSNLWVAFGTGDRIRSRTNPDSGKFLALRDGKTTVSGATVQKTDILLSDLVPLTWVYNNTAKTWSLPETNIKVAGKWGWQFSFPMAHEKLFDPDPFVLPDANIVPHIYLNTYQPAPTTVNEDCDAPDSGIMFVYELASDYSGDGTMGGTTESGRIAGGGMFGSDYITFIGDGEVASIPPLKDIKPLKLFFTGSMLFMKEKKR